MKAEQTEGKKSTADTFGISKLLSVQRQHKRLKTLVGPSLSEYKHVEYNALESYHFLGSVTERSNIVLHQEDSNGPDEMVSVFETCRCLFPLTII
jgi:hypothetical protein